MELFQLCKKIMLPDEVCSFVYSYHSIMTKELQTMLTNPSGWKQGLSKLNELLGEDENKLKSLSECLLLACDVYDRYQSKGIPDDIFFESIKFCTRFLNEYYHVHGHYAFTWTWWFVRQLSFLEFRVGELEFEFTENKIYIHIPSDADLHPKKIDQTLNEFQIFLKTYFPDLSHLPLYCESWMLSPVLFDLLPETSRILSFQKRFTIEKTEASMAVLDWVFPGESDLSTLSEKTTLQRNMKRFLLAGGNVGWALGKLK